MSQPTRKSIDKRSIASAPPPIPEEPYEEIEILDGETSITHCILKNCVDLLMYSMADEINHDCVSLLLDHRNQDGRTPLELCAILGREEITKLLIQYGANVNLANCAGYTPAHYAAAWGQTQILKLLIEEAHVDLSSRNLSDETPRQIALRYSQMECVDFIDWIEAKHSLETAIKKVQERFAESERRPTKEEKNIILNSCKEKQHWLDHVSMPTTQDFIIQQELLETTVNPVLAKLFTNPTVEKK